MNNLNHLGVILDGNRRWAEAKGLDPWRGHWAGADKAEEFLDWCFELGIPEVSMYVLSSENFEKKSRKELQEIFKVLLEKAQKLINDEKIHKYEVKVNTGFGLDPDKFVLEGSFTEPHGRLCRRRKWKRAKSKS